MGKQGLRPGDRVAGRYQLEQLLSSGSMGWVFAALDARESRRVALKVLAPNLANWPRAVARFAREAEVTAAVTHTGVVQVFDHGRDGDWLYVALEWLEGEDFKSLLARRAPLSVEEVCRLGAELADVVASVHRARVVHRDIKPSNLYLARGADGAQRVKLLDFGLARDAYGEPLTNSGEVFGTLMYMAPEQLVSARAAREPADVWSLGAVLYEMLTGGLPFDAPDDVRLMSAILGGRPVPIERRGHAHVPRDVAQQVMACLQFDTSRRPSAAKLSGWLAASRERLGVSGVRSLPPPRIISDVPPAPSSADARVRRGSSEHYAR